MRISCPSCQSSYKIADEKVQGRTVKVRCRKCGLTIHVNEQGVMNDAAGGAPAPAEGGADAGSLQFSVLIAEGDQRDMGLKDIVAAYNSGVVTGDTFVWAEGQPDWMPLGEVPAIIDALNAASEAVDKVATSAPATEPPAEEPVADPGFMTTATPGPVEAVVPAPAMVPAPAPTPEPAPAAVVPQPLFGQGASAATPSPLFGGSSEAAVQRSHEKKPDLFSAQAMAGTDDDVATSAPQVSPVLNKPTGARDESSVLFSLSALTSAAASTSGSLDTSAGGDDSGLIDLRALAEKDAAGGQQPVVAAPVGGILDSAPLLGTPIMDPSLHQLKASDPPPAKKNTILIVGIVMGGVGILSLAATVVVLLMREPPPPAPLPVATTTEVAQPVVPVVIPSDTGSSAAAPPATGAASAPPTPTTTARPTGPRPKSTGTSASTGGTGKPSEPAPTKKPPANKCNCPPGDLACNMACAVK